MENLYFQDSEFVCCFLFSFPSLWGRLFLLRKFPKFIFWWKISKYQIVSHDWSHSTHPTCMKWFYTTCKGPEKREEFQFNSWYKAKKKSENKTIFKHSFEFITRSINITQTKGIKAFGEQRMASHLTVDTCRFRSDWRRATARLYLSVPGWNRPQFQSSATSLQKYSDICWRILWGMETRKSQLTTDIKRRHSRGFRATPAKKKGFNASERNGRISAT